MKRSLLHIFCAVFLMAVSGMNAQLRFKQIPDNEELSHNTIRSIIQDREGFMWIGTYNGIDKYDGYRMQHYRFSTAEKGLSSNIILSLFEDDKGMIWAGTTNAGINRIDVKTDKVSVYFNDPSSATYTDDISEIYQDASGALFILQDGGINVFKVDNTGKLTAHEIITEVNGSPLNIQLIGRAGNTAHWVLRQQAPVRIAKMEIETRDDKFTLQFHHTDIQSLGLKNETPLYFFAYPENTLWIATDHSRLIRIDLDENLKEKNRTYLDLAINPNLKKAKRFQKVKIVADHSGQLWYANDAVLARIDPKNNEIQYFTGKHVPKDIYDIYVDYSNILWIGTLNEGLYNVDLENHTFSNSEDFLSRNPFKDFPILALTEDEHGNILIGLQKDGGLYTLKESELSHSLKSGRNKIWDLKRIDGASKDKLFEIKRLKKGREGVIWAGSRGAVSKLTYNSKTEGYKIHTYNAIKDNTGNPIINTAFALEEDRKGDLWAGFWLEGLVKMHFNERGDLLESKNFRFSKDDSLSLSNNYVRDILEDSKGNLWVGTIGGLNKLFYDEKGNIHFKRFLFDENDPKSLSNNYILDIYESQSGAIFIGTFGGGLNKLTTDLVTGKISFEHISVADGLPSDVIFQISEDDEGNLWLMHIRQLSKLDPETGKITYFDRHDGFSVKEFKENAFIRSQNGLILAGGVNGFTFFQPSKMTVNTVEPKIAIEELKIFNEPVKPFKQIKGRTILQQDINSTQRIELPYFLNSIEFVFSSLHFANPDKNRYKYILEGYSDKWQYSKGDERRFATFMNIPPGSYTFKVNGSNSSGVWAVKPRQIEVVVKPPWYAVPWTIALYVLLIIAAMIYLSRIRMRQIRLKSQLDLESALHEKSEEINRMKLQFFTNISHELRTPLTLIIGPLQQIMSGNSDPAYLKRLNKIMYKNALRLLKLINQLLDFRKAESGDVELVVKNDDLVRFVGEICNAFDEVAQDKGLKFVYLPEEKEMQAWFDGDKIEKVVYNLLSNAFKFTPKGKSVKVELKKQIRNDIVYAVIRVIDYGIGIPENELKNIFERFYQAKKENSFMPVGSGLGLAYTRQLVEIHKGKIKIESKLHHGTVCTVEIPVSRKAYDDEQVLESQVSRHSFRFIKQEIRDFKDLEQEDPVPDGFSEKTADAPKLLIVEDNKELREYMFSYFNRYYRVKVAENGEKGLEMIHSFEPDIVVTDLMMPVMNGIEMCRTIKTDVVTSHIPVIILTAKAGIENEKEGLETGAEEFVLKPFHIEILKLRIENILKTRKKWVKKYKKAETVLPVEPLSNKIDQLFLEKATKIVNENIDNTNFNVEVFAAEMAMSRSNLFKKLKSVTGFSSSEFIRSIRVKKAAEYLRTGKYSITEVLFMVGFSDPKHFRTSFKKQFGMTPSAYLKTLK